MFELVSKFIFDLIKKVSEKAIDIKADNLKQRHLSFTHFFDFYKALFDYEAKIEETTERIRMFQTGEVILLKSKVEALIKEIFEAHKEFESKLSLIRYHFSIYLPSIIIMFEDFSLAKPNVIYQLVKSVDLIPKQELLEEGGLTYSVYYPKRIPTSDELKSMEKCYKSKIAKNLNNKNAIKSIENEILKELKLLSNSKSINFENNCELDEALQNSNENLQRIKDARILLAKFLRDSFQLKDILI